MFEWDSGQSLNTFEWDIIYFLQEYQEHAFTIPEIINGLRSEIFRINDINSNNFIMNTLMSLERQGFISAKIIKNGGDEKIFFKINNIDKSRTYFPGLETKNQANGGI